MVNKTLLKKTLLFAKTQPVFSIIKDLNEKIVKYQSENEVIFFSALRGQRASVLNEKLFFEFISQELMNAKTVESYEDIKKVLYADTREQNIKLTGDSKTNYVRVFDNVVVMKNLSQPAHLLQKKDLDALDSKESYVVVENAESFLNIESLASEFKYTTFIYLGGYANSLTREFLQDKELEFFLDFDIEGLNIYESFECKSKSFFIPKNLEQLFVKYANVELYKKQLKNFKTSYSNELLEIENLIKKYNAVVEQEVLR